MSSRGALTVGLDGVEKSVVVVFVVLLLPRSLSTEQINFVLFVVLSLLTSFLSGTSCFQRPIEIRRGAGFGGVDVGSP